MQFSKFAALALVAVASPAIAAPVKFEGKAAAALGACSALTGVAAAACYNTGHKTAGYALTGVSGATGSLAAAAGLKKKPAANQDVELASHNSDAASHHSDAASHHSGSSGGSFHTAHSHKRSIEENMEEFE